MTKKKTINFRNGDFVTSKSTKTTGILLTTSIIGSPKNKQGIVKTILNGKYINMSFPFDDLEQSSVREENTYINESLKIQHYIEEVEIVIIEEINKLIKNNQITIINKVLTTIRAKAYTPEEKMDIINALLNTALSNIADIFKTID